MCAVSGDIQLGLMRIIRLWAVLTVVLALGGGLAVILEASGAMPGDVDATTFVVMLNAVNLVLLVLFLALRKRVERGLENLLRRSASQRLTTTYRHELVIGRAFVLLLAVAGLVVTYLAFFRIDDYYSLIREDGPVEYLSALFWLLSAAILTSYAVSRRDAGTHSVIFAAALIAFFIVCGGEEISWGQRLTNHETPEWLGAVNVQEETTLHNIGSISVFANAFFVLTLVFFLVLPHLARRHRQVRDVAGLVGFPIPSRFPVYVYVGSLVIWILVGLRFGTLGFHPFSVLEANYYTQMDDELFELLAAYSFLCFSISHGSRSVSVSGPAAARPD